MTGGIKEPTTLSPRIKWLRDYYFDGAERKWNNEFTCWTTGTPWDRQYHEFTYYIVPEAYEMFDVMKGGYQQAAKPVDLPNHFWEMSLVERRAWFVRQTMVHYVPQELLPGDLLAGARFNIQTSMCLTRKEQKKYDTRLTARNGARAKVKWFHDHGYGNAGATCGHLVPGYENVLRTGWTGLGKELDRLYARLSPKEKKGPKGCQLKAMKTASGMPSELAKKYADLCRHTSDSEKDAARKEELLVMARNLENISQKPPQTFWEVVQTLWLTHMLVMSDENYPGPGVSLGRIDQYLYPFWEYSKGQGLDREFAKEILKCFWIHCNTAYDATIRCGNQGITAGYGQLITLSGMGPNGEDLTNDLTYLILEVIDEMAPILEPKPNVRLHKNSPDKLLETCVNMIRTSQGAPFLLNFDERSMAGMMRQSRMAGLNNLISETNVFNYAPVGCLENTMVGNDRSGTVDNNLNLLKAVELAMNNGKDLVPFYDPMTGKTQKIRQDGPATGEPATFLTFESFYKAFEQQMAGIVEKCVDLYEASESVRAEFFPTPYLSCLVKGCAEKGVDITQGGAEISFTTLEAVTYATTVDSLLAIKYLVFDQKACTLEELSKALAANWKGYEVLQAKAKNRAPKYGRDDDAADALGLKVMELWCNEAWKHRTKSTGRRFRPGMLSWNYWASDGYIMAASADGRQRGQFLSNAICPSNGADINGPTSNTNSVGKVLGGKEKNGDGDFMGYVNLLPNGASHTMTFNPSMIRDAEHSSKFKAFLKGYAQNGGTALQINMLDPAMLIDAQKHPRDYRHLLVRITGYNAYFTTIGKELQDEVIHRLSHSRF
ncbi:pyruvate formate lyase family protein [uncultured Desulfosarcina sp.]|uniref:pyruvate formate lyase family protein n=1 Tax=uncultured Desulfosarcina sp. TaxID=218289 RepID=UPI0029C88426|nr:pyruvate formate lyase family protein [uncultured Desulfosarcina sp.]